MGQVLTQEQINELIIKLEKEKADNPLGDIDNTVKRKNFIAFVKALYVCKYCREMRRFEYEKGSSIYKRTRTTNLNDIFRKQCDPKIIRNVCISSASCNHNFISFTEILRNSLARHYYSLEQSKIQELEAIIENANIISEVKTDKVSVGNKVMIEYVADGETEEYMIVGSHEADPFANKISNESPIAKAIIGKKAGITVTVDCPNGEYDVKIIAIS